MFGTTLGPVWFKVNAAGTRARAAAAPAAGAAGARAGARPAGRGRAARVVAASATPGPRCVSSRPRPTRSPVGAAAAPLRRGAAAPGRPPRRPGGDRGARRAHRPPCRGRRRRSSASSPGSTEARGGLGPDRRAALEARLPAYRRWCAALAASGIPDTLQHDDLHSANVCVRRQPRADASTGAMRASATRSGPCWHAELDRAPRRAGPRRTRSCAALRDAYLEPFTPYADRRDLVQLVVRARQAGPGHPGAGLAGGTRHRAARGARRVGLPRPRLARGDPRGLTPASPGSDPLRAPCSAKSARQRPLSPSNRHTVGPGSGLRPVVAGGPGGQLAPGALGVDRADEHPLVRVQPSRRPDPAHPTGQDPRPEPVAPGSGAGDQAQHRPGRR